jgi:predicted nucleic acid-binding protein
MGENYLIDTNSISDYFSKILPENGMFYLDEILNKNEPKISIINRIELLSRLVPGNKIYQDFVNFCTVIDLDEEIILKTISIRRSRKIRIPDAIIAVTAITYSLTLITHNLSDFENIPNLKIIDLHTL